MVFEEKIYRSILYMTALLTNFPIQLGRNLRKLDIMNALIFLDNLDHKPS
jgi:hypothetical protein